ncbi:MAG TPA: DUF3800 domain-containing protein [Patescibacteria group bacterium]|nr:DUF3800 domain-containing protein [Patescibacteria group bacterium]
MDSFFFIDDSGSKEWDTPYVKEFIDTPPERNHANRLFWEKNYFVLTGLYISRDLAAELNPQINQLKKQFFGTKHVEIKSVHLRNPEKRKKYYLDRYNVTEPQLRLFIEEHWYKFFEAHKEDIQLQAFVLDKRYFKNKRPDYVPLELTSQVLFDRVELNSNRQCSIVFDQMDSQIKSVRHQQGKIIRIASKEVDLNSFHQKYSHTEVRFEKSSNSNFLQLADTAAYNVLRQFVEYGDEWESPTGNDLKMYSYFDKISDNFYCDGQTQRVAGYGVVKIPNGPTHYPWSKSKNTRE